MSIADRIKEARTSKGMKQAELAAALGITGAAVSAWERGVNKPGPEDIEFLCGALQVSPGYLLGIPDDQIGADEKRLLALYRGLKPSQKELLIRVAEEIANGNR